MSTKETEVPAQVSGALDLDAIRKRCEEVADIVAYGIWQAARDRADLLAEVERLRTQEAGGRDDWLRQVADRLDEIGGRLTSTNALRGRELRAMADDIRRHVPPAPPQEERP